VKRLWARVDLALERKIPEIWKILKWMLFGGLASFVEYLAYLLMEQAVFKPILNAPIENVPPWLMRVFELVGLTQGRGFLYTYLISITVGYGIAFVLNRKLSFKSNANMAASTIMYAVMVLFTILAGAWIGTTLSNLLVAQGLAYLTFLVKIVQMLIPGLWTYPLSRFVIYRVVKEKEDTPDA
jgi:putative flippase GtrA